MADYNEIKFEEEIAEHLAAHGWLYSIDDTGYDRERALFPDDVFGWLEDTQPKELAKVVKNGSADRTESGARPPREGSRHAPGGGWRDPERPP